MLNLAEYDRCNACFQPWKFHPQTRCEYCGEGNSGFDGPHCHQIAQFRGKLAANLLGWKVP